jgi:hypothetical protein
MSIIKERVLYNSGDINLKIPVSVIEGFTGQQQEIEKLTSFSATDLVNPVTDGEVRRFKHFRDTSTILEFQFYSTAFGLYSNLLTVPGFTTNELTLKNVKVLNSFFILEFYDSFNIYNQNKIFTTFLTKITTSNNQARYSVNSNENQFHYWYIPQSYIDAQTGLTTIGYTKFSFYNAKTGKIQSFINSDNASLKTSEKLYFKTRLNLSNMTWVFLTSSNTLYTAKEIPANLNASYNDKINKTVDNFDNLQQAYPTGNTFNYIDGRYLTT